MRANKIVIERIKCQGGTIHLPEGRTLEELSFAELIDCHPDVLSEIAKLCFAELCTDIKEFESNYQPNLRIKPQETEEAFNARMGIFAQKKFLTVECIGTGEVKVVAHNPFIPELDEYLDVPLVITSQEVIETVLRGATTSNQFAIWEDGEKPDAWLARLFNGAFSHGCQDIEITANPSAMKIRLFVDGEWTDWLSSFPLQQRFPVLRALCASAEPSFDFEVGTKTDFRLEKRLHGINTSWRGIIAPSALGETVTLRMLPRPGRVSSMEKLGYDPEAIALTKQALFNHCDGIFAITGETGSGKTTLMYSMIQMLYENGYKVVTLERPVELILPGVVQHQIVDYDGIAEKYRFTFEKGMETVVREKPNYLFVGESSSVASAKAAMAGGNAAHMTGTTMHTGSVKTTVKRWSDLGIPATVLADILRFVASQRLIQTLCPWCKKEQPDGTAIRNEEGCSHCKTAFRRKLGYYGRAVIYEMCYFDEIAREKIIAGDIESDYPRLEALGMYIPLSRSVTRLIAAGSVDPHDVKRLIK